jgi:LuxR family maltose regulon positive regulatory protein
MPDATELLLLLPKIRPPRSASKTVPRPRLARYTRLIEDIPLTVVSAPSGFGKTTAGAVWARDLKSKAAIVSWLSLDKDDNDQSRFFNYLAFAVNHAIKEHSRDATHHSNSIQHPLKGNQLITNLINTIAEEGSEFFLFLDDFQTISDCSIRDSIQFLIRNAPSNFHLILLSHPYGVADFAKGKPGSELHLNAGDLRFTEAETKELFDIYSRSDNHASLAHSMTGGWVAALRILAASNVAADGRSTYEKDSLLTEDYLGNLLNIAVAGLTPDEVSLVETTCITGRMCGSLFTALTGISQPRNIIHSVESTHNLISRVSEDGYWFSCHDLIRESVLARLSKNARSRIVEVGERASRWYAEQGYWSEAVTQALAVDNYELALQTIELCSSKLLYKGDLLTLIGWESRLRLSSLPSTSVKTLTVLALALTLAADHEQRTNLSNLLDLIDTRMRRELPRDAVERLYWHLHGIRSILACANDDVETSLKLSTECLEQPEIFPSLTQSVRCAAGYSYLQLRRWDDFYKVLTEVPRAAEDEFTFVSSLYRQLLLGLSSITQLNFTRGVRYLEEVHTQAYKKLGVLSLPGALSSGLLAFIHAERLEIDKAESLLIGSLDLVAQSGYIDCICRTYAAAERIAVLRQENEYALSLLEKWETAVSGPHPVRPQVICAYEKMCFFLREGSHIRAGASLAHIRHLCDLATSAGKMLPMETQYYAGLAQGQFALATGDLDGAKSHLEPIYREATRNDDIYAILLSATALALAEFKSGSDESAFKHIAEVLTLAHAAELKASLLCQPGDIWPLLNAYKKRIAKHAASARHGDYIDELKEARNQNFNGMAVSLSPREESVLRLIAQDKSNKEISIALKITPETVKTHLKSIFIKLNVTKRNAAVRRANAIKLL